MPLLGSIMTIAVDSSTTASTSGFEGNMTWSRPISGGSTFPSNEALPTRAIPKQRRRPAVTATSDRVSRLLSGGGAEKGPSKNAAKNNEKHIKGDERNTTTGKEGSKAARKETSHHCGQTSETRICGRNIIGATKSGETAFTGEENGAGISTGGGGSEQSVDSVSSTTDSVSVSTGVSNSTEENVAIEYGKDLLLFGFSDTMEDMIN